MHGAKKPHDFSVHIFPTTLDHTCMGLSENKVLNQILWLTIIFQFNDSKFSG